MVCMFSGYGNNGRMKSDTPCASTPASTPPAGVETDGKPGSQRLVEWVEASLDAAQHWSADDADDGRRMEDFRREVREVIERHRPGGVELAEPVTPERSCTG